MAGKRSRAFRRTESTYRRVNAHDDRFANSLANSIVTASPVIVFDMQHLLNIIGNVYRNHGRKEGQQSYYTGRQKQVMAICQYLEQRGEICQLARDQGGDTGIDVLSDPAKAANQKTDYCNALCLLNGLERQAYDEDSQQGGDDEGADYIDDHVQAIDLPGEIDLDVADDSLTEPAKE